jgi:hypothetical protein
VPSACRPQPGLTFNQRLSDPQLEGLKMPAFPDLLLYAVRYYPATMRDDMILEGVVATVPNGFLLATSCRRNSWPR